MRQSASVGIIDIHPIQYRAPLYRLLAKRGVLDFEVLFLSNHGAVRRIDPGFGVPVSWDIDLLSGYNYQYLGEGEDAGLGFNRIRDLRRWVVRHQAVMIHGYSERMMLCAALEAFRNRIPYVVRGDSLPDGHSRGIRRFVRSATAYSVVSRSFAGVAIGIRNAEFYHKYKAKRVFDAPYSVDNGHFKVPRLNRRELLASHGLDISLPVIVYCGKIYSGKRPMDLVEAVARLHLPVNVIFVGDGEMAQEVREALPAGRGVVTGFVNQTDVPSYYHAADILVMPSSIENWGLAINEAMVAGVMPVVSDRVGAAPDLVEGLGVVYECGNVASLVKGLIGVLPVCGKSEIREQVKARISKFSLERTADGFEHALLAALEYRRSLRI